MPSDLYKSTHDMRFTIDDQRHYNTPNANALKGVPREVMCPRCGENYGFCPHLMAIQANSFPAAKDAGHAERIKARYAFGKRFNPDHDEADYYTDPPADAPASSS